MKGRFHHCERSETEFQENSNVSRVISVYLPDSTLTSQDRDIFPMRHV